MLEKATQFVLIILMIVCIEDKCKVITEKVREY